MTTPSCQLLADVHDQYPIAMTAAEKLKDVKPDRETRGMARGLANQSVLYGQFIRKMVLLSGITSIRGPELHQIVTERLGVERTGLLIGKLKEMLRLLADLTLDFHNVIKNETLRQQLQGPRETSARANSKKSKVQRRLDKVSIINLDLAAMLEPRLPLPFPDVSDPSSSLRAFIHENRNHQSDAIRVLAEAYGCSCPEPHVAGLRCMCSRCNPSFDDYEPYPGDWDFEVAFIAQPEIEISGDSDSPLKRLTTAPSLGKAQPTVWVSRLSLQGNHPNLAPDVGLCSFLRVAAGCSGEGIRHLQGLQKSPLAFSTLDELLRSRDPPLNRSNRMALAYRLSSAVLQAAGTPCADDSCKPKDWIVGVNDDDIDQFPVVFLNQRVYSGGQVAEAKKAPEDDWGVASAEPILARLGIALTQLALGRTLPDMRKDIPGLLSEDQVQSHNSELLDLLTARRLLTLNQIAQTISPAFEAVVAACVTQQYRDKDNIRELDTQQANFLERAATAILMPLYHEVRRYLGHHQSKIPANNAPRAETRRDQHILSPKYVDQKRWKPPLTPKRLAKKPRSETLRPASPPAHANNSNPGGGGSNSVANASRTDAAIASSEPSQETGPRVATPKPTEASSSDPKSNCGSDMHTPAAESTSDDDTGSMEIHNGDCEADPSIGYSVDPTCDEDMSTWSLGDYTESNQSIDSGFAWLPSDEEFVYRLHDQHPLLALSDIALKRIFREFRISMAADWPGGGAMSTRPPASTTDSTAAGKKRHRSGREKALPHRRKDDEDDDEEAHQSPPPSRAGPSTEEQGPAFACPYFKKDPVVHQGCYRYRLTRIRDVKQHVGRRHSMPSYCPICFDVFPREEERDNHVREKSCPQRPFAKPEGTTEEQKKKLGKRAPTNQSSAEQWYGIFYTLFDKSVERPQSPYMDVDRVLYHGALSLQQFIEGDGVQVLDTVLSENNAVSWNIPYGEEDAQAFRHHILGRALRTMFQQWEAQNGSTVSIPNGSHPTTSELTQNSSDILPTPPASVGQTWSLASQASAGYAAPRPPLSDSGGSSIPVPLIIPFHPASFDFIPSSQGFGETGMMDDVQGILDMTSLGLDNGSIMESLANFDGRSYYTGTSNSEAGQNFDDFPGH